MSYGMTYEQYWDGDNDLPKYYREKHKIERKRKNYDAWIQGAYIYEALLACAPVLNALAKDKKPMPYRDAPLPLTEEESKQEKIRLQEKQIQKNVDAMQKATEEFNKNFRKGDSKDG